MSIGITRAHLEEDTARLQHGGRRYSLVDFNRAGVPLMEIVTEPDIRSPAQARAYGETLRDILRHIGASDGDMETGSMRIEGNISLRPMGTSGFGTKVEVKNLNSFRSLEHAMEFEAERHAEALDRGESLLQRRAAGTRTRAAPSASGARKRRTTTATSRSRTCRRCGHRTTGLRRSARPCLSCRPHGAGYEQVLGLSAYDAGCSRRTWRWPIISIGWWRPGSRPSRPPTG